MITETAYAKVNLLLHVGRERADGLHDICSLFASVDLADEVRVRELGPDGPAGPDPRRVRAAVAPGDRGAPDVVRCPGVPGPNLASVALAAFRDAAAPGLPALLVEIDKRVPVAGGLGGGSADAAAVLRAANVMAGRPLDAAALRRLAAGVGADVPSQVEPGHAVVTGAGETVERVRLPPLALVLVPQREGLSTARVYAEADRIGSTRTALDPGPVRALAAAPAPALAGALENDLEPAALSLRPDLRRVLDELAARGALAARLTGSGPTAFGLFAERTSAERAAAGLPGALVTEVRAG